MTDRDPLEIVAICARMGTYKDPRDPRGTGGGLTMADVCAALADHHDQIAGDMALLIGSQSSTRIEEIRGWLIHWVVVECNRRGFEPKLEKVAENVDEAMADCIAGVKRNGASKYYRWAAGVLMCKAQEAAGMAVRSLMRG